MKIIKNPTDYFVCDKCKAEFMPDSKDDFKTEYKSEDTETFILPIYACYKYTYLECPFCYNKIYIKRERY